MQSSFIERTLVEINDSMERSIFADSMARKKGLLQGLDTRLKLISLIGLLMAINLSHNFWVIGALYLGTLLLASLSSIPTHYFISRVMASVLVFTGLITLPALFITPGPILYQFPLGVVITQTGCLSALFLILRVSTSVSMAALLILTTRWNNVLNSLGILHVPDVIVLILGMTYRYIHLLLHASHDMFLSRKSRILRKLSPGEERNLVSAMGGALLGKSLQISSDVYMAMQSRGFRYYPKTMASHRWEAQDYAASVVSLAVILTATWFGR